MQMDDEGATLEIISAPVLGRTNLPSRVKRVFFIFFLVAKNDPKNMNIWKKIRHFLQSFGKIL